MMKCTNSGVNNLKTLRCFERLHDSLSFPGVFEEDGYAHGKYRIAVPDAKSFETLLLLAVSVLGLMIAPAMRGQATGSFSGNVVDKSGSAIPGAAVTVTSQETDQVRAVKTDDAGHYLVPLLPVGVYTVQVAATNFNGAATKDLRLQVDEAR